MMRIVTEGWGKGIGGCDEQRSSAASTLDVDAAQEVQRLVAAVGRIVGDGSAPVTIEPLSIEESLELGDRYGDFDGDTRRFLLREDLLADLSANDPEDPPYFAARIALHESLHAASRDLRTELTWPQAIIEEGCVETLTSAHLGRVMGLLGHPDPPEELGDWSRTRAIGYRPNVALIGVFATLCEGELDADAVRDEVHLRADGLSAGAQERVRRWLVDVPVDRRQKLIARQIAERQHLDPAAVADWMAGLIAEAQDPRYARRIDDDGASFCPYLAGEVQRLLTPDTP